MTYSLFIVSEKIYESDHDLLYDSSTTTQNNPTWRNNIVLKKKENNTICYHVIREEENIMTLSLSYVFYKHFSNKEDAIKEAFDDARFYNLL